MQARLRMAPIAVAGTKAAARGGAVEASQPHITRRPNRPATLTVGGTAMQAAAEAVMATPAVVVIVTPAAVDTRTGTKSRYLVAKSKYFVTKPGRQQGRRNQ